jgi:hypothetical protein
MRRFSIDTMLVTGASHCRGEGLALVEKFTAREG